MCVCVCTMWVDVFVMSVYADTVRLTVHLFGLGNIIISPCPHLGFGLNLKKYLNSLLCDM